MSILLLASFTILMYSGFIHEDCLLYSPLFSSCSNNVVYLFLAESDQTRSRRRRKTNAVRKDCLAIVCVCVCVRMCVCPKSFPVQVDLYCYRNNIKTHYVLHSHHSHLKCLCVHMHELLFMGVIQSNKMNMKLKRVDEWVFGKRQKAYWD